MTKAFRTATHRAVRTATGARLTLKRFKKLIKDGLMQPAGMKEYKRVTENRVNNYSFEQENIKLPREYEKKFKSRKKAWEFFQSQPPSYRKQSLWYVMSAKQDTTRERRLNTLIKDSNDGLRIKQLRQN